MEQLEIKPMEERSLIEEISRLAEDVRALRRELDEALRLLERRFSRSHPIVAKALRTLLEEVKLPKVPEEESIFKLRESLSRYREELRRCLERITRKAEELDKLAMTLNFLERESPSLKLWADAIMKLDRGLYERTQNFFKRLDGLRQLNSYDAVQKEASSLSAELRILTMACKEVLYKRLYEISKMASLALKLYCQAKSVAPLEVRGDMDKIASEVRQILDKINEAKNNAPHIRLDLEAMKSLLSKAIALFKEVLSEGIGDMESEILKALDRCAARSKPVKLHILVAQLCAMTNRAPQEVLDTMLKLSKKNLVDIKIKIS